MTSVKQIIDITVHYQVMVPDEERYPETAIMEPLYIYTLVKYTSNIDVKYTDTAQVT